MYEDVQAWHSKLCDMSTEGIVQLMEDEGIKASPGVASYCAVSELIAQKTGVRPTTGISGTFISFTDGFYQEHSPSLSRFIVGFDYHLYPQLEK